MGTIALGAHRIHRCLWQGSQPKRGNDLREKGFRALVLAAEEFQPHPNKFPGVRVHHAPLDDHLEPLSVGEWKKIVSAANFASSQVRRGRKTLVTCHAGINRSGIITAMTLCMLTGCSGQEAVRQIKSRRPGALRNSSFVHHVESVMV